METKMCKCGCGTEINKFDSRGREVFYAFRHANKEKSKAAQREKEKDEKYALSPRTSWNKGKSYVHKNKEEYANKGAWNMAMRRIYPNRCMKCGWDDASCDTHHIVPKSKGGKFTIENGIILCPNHHRMADFGMISESELRRIKDLAQAS